MLQWVILLTVFLALDFFMCFEILVFWLNVSGFMFLFLSLPPSPPFTHLPCPMVLSFIPPCLWHPRLKPFGTLVLKGHWWWHKSIHHIISYWLQFLMEKMWLGLLATLGLELAKSSSHGEAVGQGSLPLNSWPEAISTFFIPLFRWLTSWPQFFVFRLRLQQPSVSAPLSILYFFSVFGSQETLSCYWACLNLFLISIFIFCLSFVSMWSRENATKCKLLVTLVQEWLVFP